VPAPTSTTRRPRRLRSDESASSPSARALGQVCTPKNTMPPPALPRSWPATAGSAVGSSRTSSTMPACDPPRFPSRSETSADSSRPLRRAKVCAATAAARRPRETPPSRGSCLAPKRVVALCREGAIRAGAGAQRATAAHPQTGGEARRATSSPRQLSKRGKKTAQRPAHSCHAANSPFGSVLVRVFISKLKPATIKKNL